VLEALKVLLFCMILLPALPGAGIMLSVLVVLLLVLLPVWGAFQALVGKS
jgi:hypothetical protein